MDESLSRVWLFAAPWTVAHLASLSMGFSRQEYWSGLPCPSPGDLPDPGIEPRSPESPALADSLSLCHLGNKHLSVFLSEATQVHCTHTQQQSPGQHLVRAAQGPPSICRETPHFNISPLSFPGDISLLGTVCCLCVCVCVSVKDTEEMGVEIKVWEKEFIIIFLWFPVTISSATVVSKTQQHCGKRGCVHLWGILYQMNKTWEQCAAFKYNLSLLHTTHKLDA